ncbi:MAG: proton-conducting transporter membrane subunit, partial [Bacillota bacterium]
TKELNMYKLGGIWKRLPLTTIVFIIGMFGIIGMPLFNGYISKTLLHHGLVEAYKYGNQAFFYAEILYIITSIGTVCYFAKMFYYVFIRKTDNEYKSLTFDFSSLDLALTSVALLIISVGIFPNFILHNLIVPQLNTMSYSSHFIEDYIVPLSFFTTYDILMSFSIIGLGIIAFIIAKRFNLFSFKLPEWLRIEYIFFLPAYLIMKNLCSILYGDKCPYNDDDFKKLSETDIEKVGFIDRFVITTNVINKRYEMSIIFADAFIYALFITLFIVYLFIVKIF